MGPKHCKECDDFYIFSKSDKPAIRCMWCKGGAHDCIDRGNKEKLKGMFWMCRICNDVMNRQILPKIDLVKKMELIKKEIDINFEGFESKKDKNTDEVNEGDSHNEDMSQSSKMKEANNNEEDNLQRGRNNGTGN